MDVSASTPQPSPSLTARAAEELRDASARRETQIPETPPPPPEETEPTPDARDNSAAQPAERADSIQRTASGDSFERSSEAANQLAAFNANRANTPPTTPEASTLPGASQPSAVAERQAEVRNEELANEQQAEQVSSELPPANQAPSLDDTRATNDQQAAVEATQNREQPVESETPEPARENDINQRQPVDTNAIAPGALINLQA